MYQVFREGEFTCECQIVESWNIYCIFCINKLDKMIQTPVEFCL